MFTIENDKTLNFARERSISEIGKLLRADASTDYIDGLLSQVRWRLENETEKVRVCTREQGNDSA